MTPGSILADPLPTDAAPLWAAFTAFDWVIVALLAVSTLLAFFRGAIRELASLLGIVAALLLAAWNYAALAPTVARWVGAGALADALAFLLIVGIVMVLSSLIGRLLRSGAHLAGLGLLDRAGGAAIGLVRGVLAAAALTFALTAFFPPQTAVAGSQLAPYLLAAAHGVSSVVPQHLERRFATGAADLIERRTRIPGAAESHGDEGQPPMRDRK